MPCREQEAILSCRHLLQKASLPWHNPGFVLPGQGQYGSSGTVTECAGQQPGEDRFQAAGIRGARRAHEEERV